MNKFKVGDRVINIKYPQDQNSPPWPYINQAGVITSVSTYYTVKFDADETKQLLHESELVLEGTVRRDCTGRQLRVGDVIVYFTCKSSDLHGQKAKIESIGIAHGSGPHILVLKEDAVQKDLFTRKSWLWSFRNSVKVG